MDRVIGLLDAMPYLRAYSGQTFVVKVGGELLKNTRWRDGIATELAVLHRLGIKVVLVHGGGPQLDDAARVAGIDSERIAGRRITTPELLDLAVAEWRGRLSTAFVTALHLAGERAIGLSGLDGGLLRADVLHALLAIPVIPVITPLALGEQGEALNVNADTVAAEIAVALKAAKLVLLTRAPGILENPDDPASVLHWTDLHELQQLLEQGRLTGGMRPKLDGIRRALQGGVPRVHVVDGQEPQALLVEVLTTEGSGTLVVTEAEDMPAEPLR